MAPRTNAKRDRKSRRASYLALLAIMIIVLLGFTALVVDVGTLRLADAELEVAVDAAALAGASHLDGTAEGTSEARVSAVAVAGQNHVRGKPVALPASAIELGRWTNGVFHVSTDPSSIDAIQITGVVPDVPTPFAGIAFARSAVDVHALAVAVRPPPEPAAWSPCFLPIAIPKCIADQMEGAGPPVRSFQLSNDQDDDVGWAHPVAANAHVVGNALVAAANGDCEEGEPRFEEGQPANLQNGVAATQLRLIRDLLDDSAQIWQPVWGAKPAQDDDSLIPNVSYPGLGVLQGPVAIVDDAGACGGMKFNQSAPVDRLSWGVLFDVYSGEKQHKGFQILLDVGHDWEAPGGGDGSGNVVSRPPGRLVE